MSYPENNYYAIQGIKPDASLDEIKVAYRKLAKPHHPDEEEAAVKFKIIQEAHETLSNEIKRRNYDSAQRHSVNANEASPSAAPTFKTHHPAPKTAVFTPKKQKKTHFNEQSFNPAATQTHYCATANPNRAADTYFFSTIENLRTNPH